MSTNLHKELTIRSIAWMNSRMTQSGVRWGTEVMVSNESGWMADAVAFAFPQSRFCKYIHPQPEVWPDSLLYVFETKISRNDFNRTFSGKKETHKLGMIGNLHYVVTPKDLIKIDELPSGWGWLIQSGNGLKEVKRPAYNEISDELRYKIGYRMLWNNYSERSAINDWVLKRGELF